MLYFLKKLNTRLMPVNRMLSTTQKYAANANTEKITTAVVPGDLDHPGTSLPVQDDDRNPLTAEANLAYDRSGGPRNGRVYMVYTDRPAIDSDDTDIYERYSDDDGTRPGRDRASPDRPASRQSDPALPPSPLAPPEQPVDKFALQAIELWGQTKFCDFFQQWISIPRN